MASALGAGHSRARWLCFGKNCSGLLAEYGEATGWAPRWFFYWSQAAKVNAALWEGNYRKLVTCARHVVRVKQQGTLVRMGAAGAARWSPDLHGGNGDHLAEGGEGNDGGQQAAGAVGADAAQVVHAGGE